MRVIYAEKPDMGTKIAAALDSIHLDSGAVCHFSDLNKGSLVREVVKQRTRDGYFKIQYEGSPAYVTWGYGHLCELKREVDYNPEYRNWRNLPLPFIPDEYELKVNPRSRAQYNVVKKLFMKADEIIVATDNDREGDLIFDYIYRSMNCRVPFKRVLFNQQAEEEFRKAFRRENLVDGKDRLPVIMAGRARSAGDMVVGAGPTAAMTLKFSGGKEVLSIGRVQTATLAMIVNRENEIRNFKPEDYYVIKGVFTHQNGKYAGLHESKRFRDKKEADAVIEKLKQEGKTGVVTDVKTTESKRNAPFLYSLTTLQMEANKKHGYSLEKTLEIAQSLYDKGFTTYPRTDNVHLPEDMVHTMQQVIEILFQRDEYKQYQRQFQLQAGNRHYFDNKKVEGHYAIVPTLTPASNLSTEESVIYDMIARSVLCMAYPNATLSRTQIKTEAAGEKFDTAGNMVVDPGFMVVTGIPKDSTLPNVSKGDQVSGEYLLECKKTEPPARYTDGTLLKAMTTCGKSIQDEELKALMAKGPDGKPRGLGRPSTHATIVKKLQDRKYINHKSKTIFPTDLGMKLIDVLPVEDLKSAVMTAQWEKRLDDIQDGKDTYESFMHDLEDAVRKWTAQIQDAAGPKLSGDRERVTGSWNGQQIEINPSWASYRFSEEELNRLFAGEEILIKGVKIKKRKYNIRGKLAEQEYKGRKFIGFMRTEISMSDEDAKDFASGIWNGVNIVFKRIWAGYRFNDDEVNRLLSGEEVTIHGVKGKSGTYSVRGELSEQEYRGKKYIGFLRKEIIPEEQNDRFSGIWNGVEVSFKNAWGGHTFSQEEADKLLAGEEIILHGLKGKNGSYDVRGKIAEQEYKGKKFVGFQRLEILPSSEGDKDHVSGTWNGREVSIKKKWGSHKFTKKELDDLFAGKEIEFTNKGSYGKYQVKGRLAEQEYNGKKFVGFQKENEDNSSSEKIDDPDKVRGIWKGKEISFKRIWAGHTFTDEEIEKLLNGEEITIKNLKGKNGPYDATGKLEKQKYKGREFIGFKAEW